MDEKELSARPPEKRRENGAKLLKNGLDPSIGKATQIQPGEVRNPGGRPKRKPIAEAIQEALEKNPEILAEIAANALEQAQLQLGWFAEVRNMLDGPVDGTSPDGTGDDPINITIRFK